MTIKVRDLMSYPVVTLAASETLSLAERTMSVARIRHLPVVDHEDNLVGLVTHRDLLRASLSTLTTSDADENRQFKRTVATSEIMETEMETIDPDMSALDAAVLMKEEKIGCLPVIEDQRLVGIITEADFLELAIRFLQTEPPVSHASPQA